MKNLLFSLICIYINPIVASNNLLIDSPDSQEIILSANIVKNETPNDFLKENPSLFHVNISIDILHSLNPSDSWAISQAKREGRDQFDYSPPAPFIFQVRSQRTRFISW